MLVIEVAFPSTCQVHKHDLTLHNDVTCCVLWLLQQTTMPPSMPCIISDYVDGAFARSAPNTAEGHRLMAAAAAGRQAGNSGSSGSGRPQGALLLRQHHAAAAAAGEPGEQCCWQNLMFCQAPCMTGSAQGQVVAAGSKACHGSAGGAVLGLPLSCLIPSLLLAKRM